MSQPIGKHRKIDLIMEPCGSSISDIQGYGQAAHSPSARQTRGLKHESNGIPHEERMGRSAKIIEK
jgi:hypothetical protein